MCDRCRSMLAHSLTAVVNLILLRPVKMALARGKTSNLTGPISNGLGNGNVTTTGCGINKSCLGNIYFSHRQVNLNASRKQWLFVYWHKEMNYTSFFELILMSVWKSQQKQSPNWFNENCVSAFICYFHCLRVW